MPISIYSLPTEPDLRWSLCDDEWRLPHQVSALEAWLETTGIGLVPGEYVADIGFKHRADASGGGSALSARSMSIMASKGIELFLSEYGITDSVDA
jgi:hypothetical protein